MMTVTTSSAIPPPVVGPTATAAIAATTATAPRMIRSSPASLRCMSNLLGRRPAGHLPTAPAHTMDDATHRRDTRLLAIVRQTHTVGSGGRGGTDAPTSARPDAGATVHSIRTNPWRT